MSGVLGVSEIAFLGYPDGRLTMTMELRRDISRVIRQVRPGPGGGPVAAARPAQHVRQPSRPHRGRRGDDVRGVPGRAQPVRAPGAAGRGGAGRAHGRADVGDRQQQRAGRALRRRHRDGRARRSRRCASTPARPRSWTWTGSMRGWGARLAAAAGLAGRSAGRGLPRPATPADPSGSAPIEFPGRARSHWHDPWIWHDRGPRRQCRPRRRAATRRHRRPARRADAVRRHLNRRSAQPPARAEPRLPAGRREGARPGPAAGAAAGAGTAVAHRAAAATGRPGRCVGGTRPRTRARRRSPG